MIAYVINQYPKVSHTFIRREILALEAHGVQVARFAVRGWDEVCIDPTDCDEQTQTQYLLQDGLAGLVAPMLTALSKSSAAFMKTLLLALRLSYRADKGIAHHLIYFAQACRAAGLMERLRVSHIHAHFGTNGTTVAMLAAKLLGVPYSFTVHGPEEFDKPQALKLGEKIRHAKFVAAVSSFGRSQLYRWVPQDQWSKIQVVRCGIDPAFYASQQNVSAAPTNRLVCVGRLCEQKGQLLLVDALLVLKQRGVPFEFVFAGDGEHRSMIDALISRYQLTSCVTITGWLSSSAVKDQILASRALILPSFAEGLPVVLMEAMSLAKPVASTYVAGIPELVIDGVNGWLFAAGDVQAIADAMQKCLRASPDDLIALGVKGRERVSEFHDVMIESKKLARYFQQTESFSNVGKEVAL